jgi:flagellar biosynthesis/type III secretory pathway M-ring protein FliF/YscJ
MMAVAGVDADTVMVLVVVVVVILVVVVVVVVIVVVVLVGRARRQDGARLAGDGELADAERLGALGRLRDRDGREEGREEEEDGGEHRGVSRRGEGRHPWPSS